MVIITLAAAIILTCTTPGLIDGDTISCGGERVRIWGIDAPERHTPEGPDATRALANLTRGKLVTCRLPPSGQTRDRYNRAVRQCFVNGQDVAAEMVRQGHAKDMSRYSGGYYAETGR